MRLSLENNLLGIDNYKQIIDISSGLIKLNDITIKGKGLKIISLDSYKIVISGIILTIYLGDTANELQNINEKE